MNLGDEDSWDYPEQEDFWNNSEQEESEYKKLNKKETKQEESEDEYFWDNNSESENKKLNKKEKKQEESEDEDFWYNNSDKDNYYSNSDENYSKEEEDEDEEKNLNLWLSEDSSEKSNNSWKSDKENSEEYLNNSNKYLNITPDSVILYSKEAIKYCTTPFTLNISIKKLEKKYSNIWKYFPLEISELDAFQLPEEALDRSIKNYFPKSIYMRKKLTKTEEKLFKIYRKLGSNNQDLKNPYTDSRLSNIPVNDVSTETMRRKWRQMIRILNFPKNLTIIELFWEIIRPKNIKKFIEIAQQNKMSKKTMAHIGEYSYRMAWLMNSNKFINNYIKISHLKSIEFKSFYTTMGNWYCHTIPLMITEGKRSTLEHRDLDTLKIQNKWEETSIMLDLINKLNNEINEKTSKILIRNAAIYSFIVTTCPPRTQNLKLLVIPINSKITKSQIKDLVIKNNDQINIKDKHYKSVSGVIFEEKTSEGYYNIIWTHYKTMKSFGIQTRIISHPITLRLFDLYFKNRNLSNNYLWQNNKGKPFYKISECFKKICIIYLNKEITISDYRIISTTKIKESGTHKQYIEFSHLCLHSESISNLHYVKKNIGKDQNNTISNLINVIGNKVQIDITNSCDNIKKFISNDPNLVNEKINILNNFISHFNPLNPVNNNNNNQVLIIPPTPPILINQLPPNAPNQLIDEIEIYSKDLNNISNKDKIKKFICPNSIKGCRSTFTYAKNIRAHLIICKYEEQPMLKSNKPN